MNVESIEQKPQMDLDTLPDRIHLAVRRDPPAAAFLNPVRQTSSPVHPELTAFP
jgi:hypothetical protein